MNMSISRSRDSIWVWLLYGLGFYFVLEAGTFFIVGSVFGKTPGQLAGPYIAFAVPAVIILPLIWWLNKREQQGASPKLLALGWGSSMALWGSAMAVAVFYSGIDLHFMDTRYAAGGFVITLLLAVVVLYCCGYYMTKKRVSSREAVKRTGTLGSNNHGKNE